MEPVAVATAASLVGDLCGVSVVVSDELSAPVRLVVVDEPAEGVFRELGRVAGVAVSYAGGVVSFGGREVAEDVAIFEAGLDGVDALREALKVVGVDQVSSVGSRVVVGGGRALVDQAERVVGMLDGGRDGWLVEVGVVRVSRAWLREFGTEWSASLGGQVGLDAAVGSLSGGVPIMGAAADGLVSAAFAASESETDARLEATGTLYVLEGSKAELQQGEVVPVPQRTVSPYGTVQTTGYDFVDTGLSVLVEATRADRGVLLRVEPRISSVVGYVESAPTVAESSVSVEVVATPGEWIVVGGLRSTDTSQGSSGLPLPLGLSRRRSSNDRESELLVVVRAVRIFGGLGDAK